MNEVLFTGQVIEEIRNRSEYVRCTKCNELTNVRVCAYYDKFLDPFNKGGSYVHYGCLSKERLAEIEEGRSNDRIQ